MANGSVNFISEINPQNDSLMIRVRILRLWKNTFQTDMIFLDEKENRIEAVVKKSLLPYFEYLLEEGAVVLVNKFGVAENTGRFRVLENPYKINFYRTTSVKKCVEFGGSLYGFDFVPFKKINSGEIEKDSTVDVIGCVVSCDKSYVTTTNSKESKRIPFQLRDLNGDILKCTLWDKFADQIITYINDHNTDDYVIVLIQFGKVHVWRENISVQNGFFVTRVFINEDIKEIVDFKKSLMSKNDAPVSSQMLSNLSSQIVYSGHEEFLKKSERKMIDEIHETTTEPYVCVVLGTIRDLLEEHDWYYLACTKCNKKAVEKWTLTKMEDIDDSENVRDTTLWCKLCDVPCNNAVPRFKIIARVQDSTGTASFTLFDRHVSRLLSRSAFVIRERQLKDGNEHQFPIEIRQILNRRCVFRIEVPVSNPQKTYSVFTVAKLSDDPKLIESLIRETETHQEVQNELQTTSVTNDAKECVSVTAESSVQRDEGTNNTPPSNGKRGREADDVELIFEHSTTKRKLVKVKIEKD